MLNALSGKLGAPKRRAERDYLSARAVWHGSDRHHPSRGAAGRAEMAAAAASPGGPVARTPGPVAGPDAALHRVFLCAMEEARRREWYLAGLIELITENADYDQKG